MLIAAIENPVAFYKCLADDTRLKCLLLIQMYSELCVCDLTSALELSQPKVSRHLAELRKCGLLQDERRGKWVYYQLNPVLPDWCKDVLRNTAKHSTDYLEQVIARMAKAQTSQTRCQPK